MIAACVVVAMVLAVLWTITQTPIYTATAEMLVKPPFGSSSVGTAPAQPLNIGNEQQIVDSLQVATMARPTSGRTWTPSRSSSIST